MDPSLFHALCGLDNALDALHHSTRTTAGDDLDRLIERILAAAEAVVAAAPTRLVLTPIADVAFAPADLLTNAPGYPRP